MFSTRGAGQKGVTARQRDLRTELPATIGNCEVASGLAGLLWCQSPRPFHSPAPGVEEGVPSKVVHDGNRPRTGFRSRSPLLAQGNEHSSSGFSQCPWTKQPK